MTLKFEVFIDTSSQSWMGPLARGTEEKTSFLILCLSPTLKVDFLP